VLKSVTNLTGQIRSMGSRISPDIRVSDWPVVLMVLARSAGLGGVVRIFPAMFGLRPPLGRDEMSCGLNATNVAARSRHPRQDARAWDELH
jgi:hypothetical protein